jgi:uncharacterized protein YukE
MHGLAQLLMCGSMDQTMNSLKNGLSNFSSELHRMAPLWRGSGPEGKQDLLNRLQSFMPASDMLKPQRLEHLVK